MSAEPDYVADIADIPEPVLDRIPIRTLADGRLIADVTGGRNRKAGVARLMAFLEWSEERTDRAMLAADIVRDIDDGTDINEIMSAIDLNADVLETPGAPDDGINCGIVMSVAAMESMIRSGRATVPTTH